MQKLNDAFQIWWERGWLTQAEQPAGGPGEAPVDTDKLLWILGRSCSFFWVTQTSPPSVGEEQVRLWCLWCFFVKCVWGVRGSIVCVYLMLQSRALSQLPSHHRTQSSLEREASAGLNPPPRRPSRRDLGPGWVQALSGPKTTFFSKWQGLLTPQI